MRQRTLLTSLLLLLSLLLSGWSSVWAAAFCPRASGQPSAQMAEPDACCRARLEQQREHCGGAAAADEAMAMDEMQPSPPVVEQWDAATYPALWQATETCTHCISHSEPASTFVATRVPEQKRRAMGLLLAPQASSPLVLHAPVSAPVLQARQHAPPGAAARRHHLLLNIFVI
ncbi:MAG TPA: hypothetical protein VGC64_10120 [Pyrinomonadaceae bacterium]|jgi:hypothetical protein